MEWAPNGRWLAVLGGRTVSLVTSDGRFLRVVGGTANAFAWSPDSSRAAWVESGWLAVTTPRGEAVIAGEHLSQVFGLVWSADSRRIVYASENA